MNTVLIAFDKRCPVCGTNGDLWKKKPRIFVCPHCSSVYSEFGLVLTPAEEREELWS
ncbi:MAG: hypothetical protein GXO64_00930 [Candidatus Micrarchaeota archaeon]|nr:hypothetical protein [Candidatus Micrarchaeota archaeon]